MVVASLGQSARPHPPSQGRERRTPVPTPLSHGTLGTCEYMKPTRTYTETQNAQPEDPRSTHSEVLPPPPAAMRWVNTHLHPPRGGRAQPLTPGAGCARPPSGAFVSVSPRLPIVPLGGVAARSERRAGRPRRRERSRGRGNRPGEEGRPRRRLWLRAAAAARRAGTRSSELGSGRGAAAGTAALPAWAEPRDTGLAGPRQPQVGRGWDGGEGLPVRGRG